MRRSAAPNNEHVPSQYGILAELEHLLWLILCLGLYWAWASSAFFGTMLVFRSPDPIHSSEIVHLVSLVTCAIVTLALPFFARNTPVRRITTSIFLACFLASCGTCLVVVCSPWKTPALFCASVITGIGEALVLYRLCTSIGTNIGDRSVLAVFASALVIAGIVYTILFVLPPLATCVCTSCLPVVIGIVHSRVAPAKQSRFQKVAGSPVRPAKAGRTKHQRAVATCKRMQDDKNRLPWKVILGFSAFGVAFGLMRGISPDGEPSFDYFYLVHELCRGVTGVAALIITAKASNRYWATSALGIAFFALSFLLSYDAQSGVANTLLNITASTGYTCFELLMWMIVYELASETHAPFDKAYGIGRGFMQVGVAAGTMTAFTTGAFFDNGSFVPAFQVTIVCMLVLMLGFFNDHNVATLWGIKKREADIGPMNEQQLSDLLAKTFALSNRECEVVMLLMKGRSEPFIAESMALSRSTIHSHIARIYTKVGVHSRQELISCVEKAIEDWRSRGYL